MWHIVEYDDLYQIITPNRAGIMHEKACQSAIHIFTHVLTIPEAICVVNESRSFDSTLYCMSDAPPITAAAASIVEYMKAVLDSYY